MGGGGLRAVRTHPSDSSRFHLPQLTCSRGSASLLDSAILVDRVVRAVSQFVVRNGLSLSLSSVFR